MKVLFLPGTYTGPAARYRLWQFVEPLKKLGHDVTVRVTNPERTWTSQRKHPLARRLETYLRSFGRVLHSLWMLRDAGRFDVIMMNRDIVPETKVTFIEPWLARRNPRLIFDFDDSIHLGAREAKLREVLGKFAWITPGNPYLAAFAEQVNPHVTILPTVVDTEQYQVVAERAPGPLRIGWSGSRSTLIQCLPLLENVMVQLAAECDFELIIISDTSPELTWQGVRWRFIPWSPETEVEGIQQIDIGLMPLRDELFERGKCGLKAIQYMAAGIPALVSPVGANVDIVVDGKTGFHCATDEAWLKALHFLIANPDVRREMGLAARTWVEGHYSIAAILPKMIETFEAVQRQG